MFIHISFGLTRCIYGILQDDMLEIESESNVVSFFVFISSIEVLAFIQNFECKFRKSRGVGLVESSINLVFDEIIKKPLNARYSKSLALAPENLMTSQLVYKSSFMMV